MFNNIIKKMFLSFQNQQITMGVFIHSISVSISYLSFKKKSFKTPEII